MSTVVDVSVPGVSHVSTAKFALPSALTLPCI